VAHGTGARKTPVLTFEFHRGTVHSREVLKSLCGYRTGTIVATAIGMQYGDAAAIGLLELG
jgi:hypothetical protein